MTIAQRRLLIRIACIVLVLLVALWMFLIGRQHTILLDNKTVELPSGTIQALKMVDVQVDKQPGFEMYPRGRDQATVMGQKHTLTMRFTDAQFNDVEIVRSFTVPVGQDMVLIALPLLAAQPEAGQDVWLTPFEPLVAPAPASSADEVVVTDESVVLMEDSL